MIDLLLVRLRQYDAISADEEAAMRAAAGRSIDFKRGAIMVHADTELSVSCLMIDGFAHRFKDLEGGRRQSMEVGVPGDFLDLHSFVMKRIDHDIAALTDCRIVVFPHAGLVDLTVTQPHLARVLWLLTLIDAAIHRQWIVSLGARNAAQRLAHLCCEMFVRLEAIGLARDMRFALPVTQERIAEMLGMSQVHVNRTLMQLRAQGVMTARSGIIEIEDWARLSALAEFDPRYLRLERRPR